MQCLSNERQIGLACAGYSLDNEDYNPPAWVDRGEGRTDWGIIIAAYFDNSGDDTYDRVTNYEAAGRFLQCPSKQIDAGRKQYGTSALAMPVLNKGPLEVNTRGIYWYKRDWMVRAGETLLIADASQGWTNPNHSKYGDSYASLSHLDHGHAYTSWDYFDKSDPDNNDPIDEGWNMDGGSGSQDLRWRHGGGGEADRSTGGSVNVLWGDGHASTQSRGSILKRNARADPPPIVHAPNP